MSVVLLSLLGGCNSYQMFSLAGYEQASFSNDADVVFVIDNSNSMWQESGEMALNFNAFIDYLTDPNGGGFQTDDLADAVDNFVSFTTRRGAQIDYQLAITTTSVDISEGPHATLDPGEAGTFVGDPEIMATDEATGDYFRQALLCEATCWPGDLPDDNKYVCGQPADEITTNYLNCPENCDVGGWDYDHCGSGTEEPLEAAYEALCRSVENPPEACFDTVSALTKADAHTNGPIVRPGSTVVVVIVTDEGDSSRRIEEGEADPAVYLDLFAEIREPREVRRHRARLRRRERQADLQQRRGGEVRHPAPADRHDRHGRVLRSDQRAGARCQGRERLRHGRLRGPPDRSRRAAQQPALVVQAAVDP